MKNFLLGLAVISFSTLAQTRYELPAKSKLNWHGEDILRNGHDGTINFHSGYILVTDKSISRGDFVIDMNTLFSLDEKTGKDIDGLSEHLKSDDFFSVERFPNAFFTILSVTPSDNKNQFNVRGFLTIKGIINQIDFQANIVITESQVIVTAEFTFDRVLWNITYQSRNFLENIKDIAIADDIKITLNLVFNKKE